ncbi:rod-binding protein [Roseovarius aestuarii]|uniref:Flagellar rod assembly protein/muramidase FlgJ n=1 Tax=Roseovarius aestuarii TaxID=475083 RepID=A0A1X7BRQ2_9RHOB|nr:rod-binding protein [Roseovarius aestuarii]SMC11879.1 flagellar rod assembly protein/muramidase FlgJ [Roseovarius aestuarii]
MTDYLPVAALRSPNATVVKEMSARQAAEKLEASFLAEMLKSAGFGAQENSFSGSAGEDQFASFQRTAMAEQMVKRGGIGLAEAFYKSMMEKIDDN